MIYNTTMIISAAGLSSRQPPNKLLIKIDEKTVIEKTVSTFINLPIEIVVVTGFQAKETSYILKKKFGDKIQLVENPNYKTGLSSSIRIGVLSVRDDCHYFGFCNGDKPFISQTSVIHLLDEIERNKPIILAPQYLQQLGHPVFFSATLRSDLLEISGDSGGKSIIESHPETRFVHIDDPGIILDMDRYLDKKTI